jgi:hypothetical protein
MEQPVYEFPGLGTAVEELTVQQIGQQRFFTDQVMPPPRRIPAGAQSCNRSNARRLRLPFRPAVSTAPDVSVLWLRSG